MPSREIRRARARKGQGASDILNTEKRRQNHPFLYGFSVVLLVVIVVTFVAAGPGGPLGRGSGSVSGAYVFGSYRGREIAYYPGSYFAEQVNTISQTSRTTGEDQNTVATAQSIWGQAYQQTVLHVAMLFEAEQAGMALTEDRVDASLLQNPLYMENGKFSEERYLKTSATDRASTRKLVRESLIDGQFQSDIFSGVKTGTRETDFIKSMAMPERSFSMVSYPFSSYPGEEIRKYGEANSSRFKKIKISGILVKSGEKEAAEIKKKIIEKTSSFEELAKAHSKDAYADKGGDMGWRYAYDLEADFDAKDTANEVFALKAGEVSPVLRGISGWLIYRCDSEAVNADFTDAAVIDDVKSYLTRYEKGKIEDYYNEKAGQLARRSGEVGFNAAVKEAGVKPVSTEYFPINMYSVFSFAPLKAIPDTATPSNAVYNEDFFFRAFSLGKNQVSPPILLDDQVLLLNLADERQLPETTASLLGSYATYLAGQSAQTDLIQGLMTPENLKDDFAQAFTTYIRPASK